MNGILSRPAIMDSATGQFTCHLRARARGVALCLMTLVLLMFGGPRISTAITAISPVGLQRHIITDDTTSVPLDQDFVYRVDESRQLTLEQILEESAIEGAPVRETLSNGNKNSNEPALWQESKTSPFRAFYRNAPVWSRFDLDWQTTQDGFLIEVQSPVLDQIEFYQVTTDATGQRQVVQYQIAGDHFPLWQSEVVTRFPVFALRTDVGQDVQVYLRIESNSAMIAPVRLWHKSALQQRENGHNFYYGVFFGIMVVMALYNLVLWVFIREHAYLYYVCYVVSAIFFQSVMSGYGYRYIWTDNAWLKDHAVVLSVALSFIFATAFVARFLRLPITDRTCYRLSLLGMAAYLLLIWLSPFLHEATLTRVGQPLGLAMCMLVVWAAARQWNTGSQVATFFIIGWTLLVIGTAIYTLMLAGFLPYNLFTRHIQEIGMLAEVVLLSFALAARINEEKQARRLALETSLSLAQRVNAAYQQQLHTQEQMTRELEVRVDERTAELQKALTELNDANQRLEELSLTDALTGLHNRRYLDRYLTSWMEFASKQGTTLTAMLIDIDHFKKINDSHGHLIGDNCIKAAATCLKAAVHRPDDLVVRYGGEEFVVVLRNTDAAGAYQVAERVRVTVEKSRWEWEGRHVPVTVSVGVAEFQPATDHNPATLLGRADEALYSAKQTGRNRVVVAANLKQQAG